jgi:hypothetical protein
VSAQSEFLECMAAYRSAIAHPDLVNKTLSDKAHNDRAKVLRKGIAVVGFCALEHFLRSRAGELFEAFVSVPVAFDDLPERLRKAATLGAVKGVAFRSKVDPDPIGMVQSESQSIASTQGPGYRISRYAAGWEMSNLNADAVSGLMATLCVQKGWQQIDMIATRLSMTLPSSKSAFENAATTRHSAAHDVKTDIQSTQLSDFVREAYAIAVAFDTLVCKAFQRILFADADLLSNGRKIAATDVKLRFVKTDGTVWREFREGATRATRKTLDQATVTSGALARASAKDECLVSFGHDGIPSGWEFPQIPV